MTAASRCGGFKLAPPNWQTEGQDVGQSHRKRTIQMPMLQATDIRSFFFFDRQIERYLESVVRFTQTARLATSSEKNESGSFSNGAANG